MDIRNTKQLKSLAGKRLDRAQDRDKILLIYLAFLVAGSLVVTLITQLLGSSISQTGGLSNMGTRSILSTFQAMLPILQSFLMMAVEFGYIAAMLRIARGQYASPRAMKMGMERFWKLLRAAFFQTGFYFAACFSGFYLATMVYLLTPMSKNAVDLITPYTSQSADPYAILEQMGEAAQAQLLTEMLPLFPLIILFVGIFLIPIAYQFRLVNYILMDNPAYGALTAMAESKRIMRGHKFQLFRVDLSLWWYHGLLALASALCYGDVLLPMLGVTLPFPGTVSYYLFYGLFLVLQTAVLWFFRNKVEVTYGLAYECIRPQPAEPQNGVVLGNIFQK